jgi:hypothetical protein
MYSKYASRDRRHATNHKGYKASEVSCLKQNAMIPDHNRTQASHF